MPRDKFEGCWRGTPLCQVTQCGRKHSREAKGWVVNTAWEEGLTVIINTRPANGLQNQEKDLLTHKERCVIHCWKEKLPQKRCIGSSCLSPALSWDNTSPKTGKTTDSLPLHREEILPCIPSATSPPKITETIKAKPCTREVNCWDWAHQATFMLCLLSVSHQRSVVLLQSCWHKVLPERGAAKESRQTKIKKNKLYDTAHCLQTRARFSEGGVNC